VPELTAALNHLRDAEPRTLGRMECHEDGAGQVPKEYGENRRSKGLMENRRGEGSGHDGEHVEVRAEPEREQLTCLAVPLIERDLVDRVLFDARGFLTGLQRALIRRGSRRGHHDAGDSNIR